MAKSTKKKDPFKLVLVLTLVVGILGACALYGSFAIERQRSERLQAMTDQVIAENSQAQQEYEQALAAFEAEQVNGTNQAWPQPAGSGWEIVDLTSYPLESVTTRTINRQDALYNGMLLVNEWHSRPEDFREDQLVGVAKATDRAISVRNSSVLAFPDAVNAFREAIMDAKGQNLENYVAYEGYRTYDEQNALFQKEMEKYKNLAYEDQVARAKKNVNYPGTSEYNSGQTLRMILYKKDDAAVNNLKFFESEQGQWLYENSWKYGIVFRFPLADYPLKGTADKSYKTGVSVKLQAFRYVGKGNAAVMHALDLCLEEYLDYLAEHPHIAVFEDGTLRYEIVRENVGNGDPFTVHVTTKNGVQNTVTSLDNMGYAVSVFEY